MGYNFGDGESLNGYRKTIKIRKHNKNSGTEHLTKLKSERY